MRMSMYRNWYLFLMIIVLTTCFAYGSASPDRPNILWLTCEDNNVDWVGCYGNPQAKTPNIDKLALQGFRYTHAFANIPVCSPTRGGWITGIHALTLGIQPMRSRNEIPHETIKYYPDYLRAQGYYTGNDRKTDYNIGGRPDGDCWDNQGKVNWEAMKKNQPFFQVINYAQSHESRAHGNVENTRFDPAKVQLRRFHPDIPGIRKNYAKYYDAVENMDKQIGLALAKLKEMDLDENTIVIHNSDHGGVMPRSKRYLFDNGIHTPLILRIPDMYKHLWPAEKPGMTVDRLVSFIDMPKTWMSLVGIEPPGYMQGRVFLGPKTEPEAAYHFAYSGRQGERLDEVRSVRDKRYYFIKNYMPYVPWGQYADYLWKMEATRAWEAHHKAGRTDEITGRFFRVKPSVEELYDTVNDPDNIRNLINDPKYAHVARRMRKALRAWQQEVFDSGLLPEEDRARRATQHNMTIYEMVHDPKLYPLKAYLDVADIALEKNPKRLPDLIGLLNDSDEAVRYWGAIGCLMLQGKAGPAKQAMMACLKDESHCVRAVAAWHFHRIGETQRCLDTLEWMLKNETYAPLKVLSVAHWMGEDARPLAPAIKAMKITTEVTQQWPEQKKNIVLKHLGVSK